MSARLPIYAAVSDAEWHDWRWQQKTRVTTLAELERALTLSEAERAGVRAASKRFRMSITPYYLSLCHPDDPACPIRRQVIPSLDELRTREHELVDPLNEEGDMPVPGLTQRYPDRVMLYTTHNCAAYCRFCTRKRKVGDPRTAPTRAEVDQGLGYIARTPAVRDVLISGGDPLSLSSQRLRTILETLAGLEHVEVARLCTRNLVTLPQRVDDGLVRLLDDLLGGRLSVFVLTHFNHPAECTEAARRACERIARTGTPMLNQMVLLRGVNDDVETVRTLNRALLRLRIKPYYMHHADLAEGIGHFRVPLPRGLEIVDGLRGWSSGIGAPQYVVDLPGGGGKVPLLPDYVVDRAAGSIVLRAYDGRTFTLPTSG